MVGPIDLGVGYQGGFFGTARGQHQAREHLALVQRQRHGQRAAHRAQLTRERQLTRKLMTRQPCGVNLPAGGQNAQSDGQVKPPRILGQVGRG